VLVGIARTSPLAEDVYKENAKNRGVNDWKIEGNPKSNFDSGLQIQNYQNATHPNHTVIAIAGTNGVLFCFVVVLRRFLSSLNRLLGSY
jgi:hypothetical protein